MADGQAEPGRVCEFVEHEIAAPDLCVIVAPPCRIQLVELRYWQHSAIAPASNYPDALEIQHVATPNELSGVLPKVEKVHDVNEDLVQAAERAVAVAANLCVERSLCTEGFLEDVFPCPRDIATPTVDAGVARHEPQR
jgi:hypothetical protein